MSRPKPRIAICGLHDECSTFCPHQATAADFTVTRGEQLLQRYPWLREGDRPWAQAVEWVPILHARSVPSGPVAMDAYREWKREICEQLASQGPFDGLYFDIHGAMYVTGMEDMEGDLITAIREVVGPKIPISCTMDLHGNVSPTLFHHCDMMTCFRLAPHEDTWETRERGAENLVQRLLAGKGKPAKAMVYVPILLPGEKTSTRLEPAKSLYAQIPEITAKPGIDDASIWIGYAWADEPRSKAVIVVYGDDAQVVQTEARGLAKRMWERRDEFEFVAPAAQFDECLEAAIAAPSSQRPFFISDSGDNPGAGGADDVTFALAKMLACQPLLEGGLTAVCASIYDPEAVAQIAASGIGNQVDVTVGAKIDRREPGPVQLRGRVGAIADDPVGGRVARVDVGGLHVFITERRMQFSELDDYRRLGIEPAEIDIICVKIGYLEPQLHAIAKGWLLALTPGGVDQDLLRLEYNRIDRPMFPFDPQMPDPDFTVYTG